MRSLVTRIAFGVALASGAGLGCTANIHDNTISIPNAKVDVTSSADTTNVKPSQPLPLQAMVQNIYLVDPSMTPPPEHMSDAGHLEVFMDSVDSPAILITAQTNFTVTIPPNTAPGDHKIICRVHKHDGTPTSTMFELKITVKT
jgi:hypothetical protein